MLNGGDNAGSLQLCYASPEFSATGITYPFFAPSCRTSYLHSLVGESLGVDSSTYIYKIRVDQSSC